jgi:nitroimidazol reductase NimA-like FMN-containing flavoprotein (pyridoxamine 5'-phosphate oxidase superfamily)
MDLLSDVKSLFKTQPLAVLATHGEEGVYANLVAFAADDDLRHIVFATPRGTRKYANLGKEPTVAMLVDSRSNRESDFTEAVAVTIMGSASECAGSDCEALMQIYLRKHPGLKAFVADSDTALMRLTVERYVIAGFRQTHIVLPV